MHRIVHLDLKGAPLKVPYLEKVLLAAREWGATGILFEWEDTFPYSGDLEVIGSKSGCGGDEMYSVDEVQHILQFAKDNGLEPIQLVQTIGHMEFVLKHPAFRGLREAPHSPAVLCPSQQASQQLVRTMLEQVLDAQPDATYLHIGADEVWHSGVCKDCQARAAESEYKAASLYLEHVRDIALFLKQKRPNLTVLMWDDMLRSIRIEGLKAHQLGELLEPVLWDYNHIDFFRIDRNLWDKYRQVFPRVWAGSAFKGANGSCQMLSPVSRYVSNHEAWLREFKMYGSDINFAGIILTGWSRYDHYATLCELLPVSLPSLASCLKMLTKKDEEDAGSVCSEVVPSSQWPGEQVARGVHSLVLLRQRCSGLLHGDLVNTWLNPWQLENNYTNPTQIEGIAITAQLLLSELTTLETDILLHLHAVTGKRSVQEWTETFIRPTMKQLQNIYDAAISRVRADASVAPTKLR